MHQFGPTGTVTPLHHDPYHKPVAQVRASTAASWPRRGVAAGRPSLGFR